MLAVFFELVETSLVVVSFVLAQTVGLTPVLFAGPVVLVQLEQPVVSYVLAQPVGLTPVPFAEPVWVWAPQESLAPLPR